MTRFKKCETRFACDGTRRAHKIIVVDYHNLDDKLGNWEKVEIEAGQAGGGASKTETLKKHKKWHVCNLCYETLEAHDFEIQDTDGSYIRAERIHKL